MPKSLQTLDAIPRKTLTMGSEGLSLRGEGDRKPLADDVMRREIGRAIERALALAGMTKQQAAFAMGYSDQSPVSRWINGLETAQFAKLFTIAELRAPLVIALAELTKEIDVTTTISIRRSA